MAFYYQSGAGAFGALSPPRPSGQFQSSWLAPPQPSGQFQSSWLSPPQTPPRPQPDLGASVSHANPPPPAPAAPNFNVDYSNDPILGRIRALAEESTRAAEADALSSRTRLAIGFGDPDFARSLGLKDKVAQQAAGNTFGTVQELARGKTRRDVFDINRPLSDHANLFYSSERGRQLAMSGEQLLRDRALAQGAVQDQVARINAAELQAKLAAQAQIIQAEQDAYNRALQQALYSAGAG